MPQFDSAAPLASTVPSLIIDPARVPVLTLFRDRARTWLAGHASEILPQSVRSYGAALAQLDSIVGDLDVQDITPRLARDALRILVGRGYSRSTVRTAQSAFSQIMDECVFDELLERNPVLKLKVKVPKPPRPAFAYTFDQRRHFLEVARNVAPPNIAGAFALMAYAGLRPSEARVVRVTDVDLVRQVLRVGATGLSARVIQEHTKTKLVRDVDLSPAALAVVEPLLARRSTLLFPGPESAARPYSEAVPWHWFQIVADAAQLELGGPHILRHTFASILIAAGTSPEYVRRMLGHTSIRMTLDTYGRWLPMPRPEQLERD